MEDLKLVKAALLEWIEGHKGDKDCTYVTKGKNSYSLNDLYKELESESDTGIDLAKGIISLTLDLLIRGKKNL